MQKNAKFSSAPPLASGGWGRRPQTPQTAPPLQISGCAPDQTGVYVIENLSLDNFRQVDLHYAHFAITRDGLNIWLIVPWAPRSDETFFWSSPVFGRKILQKSQNDRGSTQSKSARAITWLVGVTIYSTFFNNNSPPPRQFLCNEILLKKISYSKGNAR